MLIIIDRIFFHLLYLLKMLQVTPSAVPELLYPNSELLLPSSGRNKN